MATLPRRLSEVIKKKEQFLNDMRAKLEKTAIKQQGDLFASILEQIIPQLDVRDGVLLETANNYRVISEIDKVYDTFNTQVAEKVLPALNSSFETIAGLSGEFFRLSLTDDMPKKFENVLKGAKDIIDAKIGLRQGKMIRGGLADTMLKVKPDDFKQLLSRAVTSQMPMKEFIGAIKENVIGTEVKNGTLDRQFKRFAYDTYQQYDAAYNKEVAKEFDMKYFLYSGGTIDDSRDFCVCHNNKVFTTEEAKEWKEWNPSKCAGEYPAGYEVKQKDIYAPPSYLGYPGYDPLVDRGGYNCRHILAYITESLAFKLRPDLKDGTGTGTGKPDEEVPIKVIEQEERIEPTIEDFTPAATIKEAEKFALQNLGMQYADYKGLSIEIVNDINRGIYNAKKIMPDLPTYGLGSAQKANKALKAEMLADFKKGKSYTRVVEQFGQEAADRFATRQVNKLVPRVGENTVAWSVDNPKQFIRDVVTNEVKEVSYPKYKGIFVNEKVGKNYTEMIASIKKYEESGWWIKGDGTFNDIVQHELGHEIDRTIGFRNTEVFKKIYSREHALGIESVKKRLSEYGATAGGKASHKPHEMIAEAWAEFTTSKAPRELAKEIGEALLKDWYEVNIQGTGTTFTVWRSQVFKLLGK